MVPCTIWPLGLKRFLYQFCAQIDNGNGSQNKRQVAARLQTIQYTRREMPLADCNICFVCFSSRLRAKSANLPDRNSRNSNLISCSCSRCCKTRLDRIECVAWINIWNYTSSNVFWPSIPCIWPSIATLANDCR